MKERITELWDKAAKMTARLNAGRNSWETEVNFMNTFAELIVQECVNVLHDNELWNQHISHALKEHFGVEE